MRILKREFEINELKNSDIRVGDVINLPEFTVQKTTISGENELPFRELTIKDTALVYKIEDNKLYLVFDHLLFASVVDLNNECNWKDTQLCKYLTNCFQPAMKQAGIPAKDVSLLSKDEVFGEKALPFFKIGRNRIAFPKSKGFGESSCSECYWLKTTDGQYYYIAYYNGYSSSLDASTPRIYVRPCFVIEL